MKKKARKSKKAARFMAALETWRKAGNCGEGPTPIPPYDPLTELAIT